MQELSRGLLRDGASARTFLRLRSLNVHNNQILKFLTALVAGLTEMKEGVSERRILESTARAMSVFSISSVKGSRREPRRHASMGCKAGKAHSAALVRK